MGELFRKSFNERKEDFFLHRRSNGGMNEKSNGKKKNGKSGKKNGRKENLFLDIPKVDPNKNESGEDEYYTSDHDDESRRICINSGSSGSFTNDDDKKTSGKKKNWFDSTSSEEEGGAKQLKNRESNNHTNSSGGGISSFDEDKKHLNRKKLSEEINSKNNYGCYDHIILNHNDNSTLIPLRDGRKMEPSYNGIGFQQYTRPMGSPPPRRRKNINVYEKIIDNKNIVSGDHDLRNYQSNDDSNALLLHHTDDPTRRQIPFIPDEDKRIGIAQRDISFTSKDLLLLEEKLKLFQLSSQNNNISKNTISVDSSQNLLNSLHCRLLITMEYKVLNHT